MGFAGGGKAEDCAAAVEVRIDAGNKAYAGGLAGFNDGCNIKNCDATGAADAGSRIEHAYAGGLVGYNRRGAIGDCAAYGETASSSAYYAYAGGVAGYNETDGTVNGCRAFGGVTIDRGLYAALHAYAGGLTGENKGSVTNSSSAGGVSASSSDESCAGGLAGINSGAVSACSAKGAVFAEAYSSYAGGVAGRSVGTVTNCYAAGAVGSSAAAAVYAGGLIGENAGVLTHCYAAGAVGVFSDSAAYAGGLAGISRGGIDGCVALGDVMAEAYGVYAGGITGDGGEAVNSYRYEYQTVPQNAGGDERELCSALRLSSKDFYLSVLAWDGAVWDFTALDFSGGRYPVLK